MTGRGRSTTTAGGGTPALRVRAWLAACAIPAFAWAGAAPVAAADAPVARPAVASATTPQSPLERRMALLTAELDLDANQQQQVKAALLRQRELVRQAWDDPALSPALRVGRLQAISDRTADAIRAVLDDAQRRRYLQARPREAAVGTGHPDVERWMQPDGHP
ncbi:MAG: hypothetical protein ACTHL8_05185 [Burkholderiaceae bacterium]